MNLRCWKSRMTGGVLLGGVGLGLMALAVLPCSTVFATSTEAEIGVNLGTALAMTITPAELNLVISPTNSGTETKGEIIVDVSTNNPTGYKLTMNTLSSSTNLLHGNGTNTIPSVTYTTAASLTNNTWGYNKGSSSSTSTFLKVPSPADTTTNTITTTNQPTLNDLTTITIGAKADLTIPAGIYSNTLLFTAVTNYVPTPTVIGVSPTWDNSGTGTTGSPITITGTGFFDGDNNSAVTNVMVGGTRCTNYEVLSDTELTCILPAKTIGGSYSVAVTTTGTSNRDKNVTYYESMQDMTFAYCENMVMGDSGIEFRVDSRDSQLYRVRKMEDNKCWMIDNLKYAPTGQLNGDYYTQPANSRYMTKNGSDTTTASDTTETNYDIPMYADPSSYAYCAGTTNMPSDSTTKCGYLYNWYGATYGTGTTAVSSSSAIVSGNICPNTKRDGVTGEEEASINRSWRLPVASPTVGDFAYLNGMMAGLGVASNDTSLFANWLYGGKWQGLYAGTRNNAFTQQNTNGHYWSSLSLSSNQARPLSFSGGSVYSSGGTLRKSYGAAVRCVLAP